MRVRMHWGLGIALVYGVFASGTLTFAWFAMHQPVDLVSPDYYERALEHDRQRAAIDLAHALADRFAIAADEPGGALTIGWLEERVQPREGTATFYRPSNPAWDRRVALAPDASGRQRLSLSDLSPGHWILQLRWRADAGEFYVERPVDVR